MTLLLFIACAEAPSVAPPAPDGAPGADGQEPVPVSGPVVIYSGRGESLVGELFERVEAETGVEVEVRYGDTPELVTLMLTEGAQSPADMIFAQDSGHLGALAERDLLRPITTSLLAEVDPRFQDAEGRWIGTSGRARVLVHNTSVTDLPTKLAELGDPKWKGKLGWAPGNGSFQSHVSALRHIWGEEETRAWLEAVKANEPQVYPKNSPQVEAAHVGEISLGWVNHYYLHKKKTEGYQAANWSFPEAGDAGNVLMLAGVGVRAGSQRIEQAEKVIAWLVSEDVQGWFAQNTLEYPVRPGVPTHPDVPALDSLQLAEIEQAWLADLAPTRAMLQDLGLI